MTVNSRTISTENGRKIHITEAGQADGMPVIVHNGTPGSGLLDEPWIEDANARGMRLISYDRPGYGGSTPDPGRTVASAAGDVEAIAKELDLKRLLVVGMSGGGPHALACAALLPDRVVAAAALGCPAPYPPAGLDWLAGMGEDNVAEFGAAFEGREAVRQFVEAAAPGVLATDPAALVQALGSLLCPVDVAVLKGGFAKFLVSGVRAGIKDGTDGWVDDDLAFTTPWGFELSQIRIPVLLMHGKQDQMAPFSHGEWLSQHIPGVEARFFADEGHLSLFVNRFAEVLDWFLNKL